jgi:hypothetical protein
VAIQAIGSGRRHLVGRSGFGQIVHVGGLSAQGVNVTFIAGRIRREPDCGPACSSSTSRPAR